MSRAVKYQTLVNVLDRICGEAPAHLKRYHVSEANQEALNQARSRAYIHLYVKVMYGLLDFTEREKWITDGSSDGGSAVCASAPALCRRLGKRACAGRVFARPTRLHNLFSVRYRGASRREPAAHGVTVRARACFRPSEVAV